jgi:hypothetical protein
MEDEQIRTMLGSLSRPHPSGGRVVESAALLAAGGDYEAVVAWIVAHAGAPEVAAAVPQRGLHGPREGAGGRFGSAPARFVLPPGALV